MTVTVDQVMTVTVDQVSFQLNPTTSFLIQLTITEFPPLHY